MITNAVLGGIADTVAQTLTSVRTRTQRRNTAPNAQQPNNKDGFLSIQIADLDEKHSAPQEIMTAAGRRGRRPPPFDFERLTRFMAYGFIVSPVQYHWYGWLARVFPIVKGAGVAGPALKRVACDQLIFAPVSLACFFTFMTVAEGGGRRAVGRKLQDMYLPALKANWMVWPAVQSFNFLVVPLPFQIVSYTLWKSRKAGTDGLRSRSCRRSVSCGRRTYRSPTRPTRHERTLEAGVCVAPGDCWGRMNACVASRRGVGMTWPLASCIARRCLTVGAVVGTNL